MAGHKEAGIPIVEGRHGLMIPQMEFGDTPDLRSVGHFFRIIWAENTELGGSHDPEGESPFHGHNFLDVPHELVIDASRNKPLVVLLYAAASAQQDSEPLEIHQVLTPPQTAGGFESFLKVEHRSSYSTGSADSRDRLSVEYAGITAVDQPIPQEGDEASTHSVEDRLQLRLMGFIMHRTVELLSRD